MVLESHLASIFKPLIADVGRRLRQTQQRKATARLANPFVADKVWSQLRHQLSEAEIRGLLRYLRSPDFEQLAYNLVLSRFLEGGYTARAEEITSSVREQLGHGLRHYVSVAGQKQTTLADLLLRELIIQLPVEKTGPIQQAHQYDSLKLAADGYNTAAGVRNSALLQSVKDLDDFMRFAADLCSQVRALHADLPLPHVKPRPNQPKQYITLEQLYVEPTFNPPLLSLFDEPVTSWTAGWVKIGQRTVVLGDPGAGKSTFAVKLAYDLADQGVDNREVIVPLLIVLRDFTTGFKQGGQTLVSYIEARCRDPYHLPPTSGAIEYLLLNGRAVVILDGLDELSDGALRRRVVTLIEGFVLRYPLTPIVVTSRKIGYDEAPLNPGMFQTVQLDRFNDAAVERYAVLWFRLQTENAARAKALSEAFIRESEQVLELRSNPLMLSLLCGIFHAEHYIPSNRPEVYQRCALLLYEQWDTLRDIGTDRIATKRRGLIAHLAWHLYSRNTDAPYLPEPKIRALVARYLLRYFEDEDAAHSEADDFLETCTGRAWVLADVGATKATPLYGFTHRTFLEFFSADFLVRTERDIPSLSKQLRTPISHGQWIEVAHLVVEILDRTTEGAADELIELLLEPRLLPPDPDARISLVLFSSRCLSYVVPAARVLHQVVDATVELASFSSGDTADAATINKLPTGGGRPLAALLSSCRPDNILMIKRALTESFAKYLRDEHLRLGTLFVAAHLDEIATQGEGRSLHDTKWNPIYRQLQESLPDVVMEVGSNSLWYLAARAMDNPEEITNLTTSFGLTALYHTCWIMDNRMPSLATRVLERGARNVKSVWLSQLGDAIWTAFDINGAPLSLDFGELQPLLPAIAQFFEATRSGPLTRGVGGLLILGLPALEAAADEPRFAPRVLQGDSIIRLISARRSRKVTALPQLLKADGPAASELMTVLERWVSGRQSFLQSVRQSGQLGRSDD